MRIPLSLLVLISVVHVATANIKYVACNDDETICDSNVKCTQWKAAGECVKNAVFVQERCPFSCREEIAAAAAAASVEGESVEDVPPEEAPVEETSSCADKHADCEFWAKGNECTANPAYMQENCCRACLEWNNEREHQARAQAMQPQATWKTLKEEDFPLGMGDEEKLARLLDLSMQFGVRQIGEGERRMDVGLSLRETLDYFKQHEALWNAHPPTNCVNRKGLCHFWKVEGECTSNRDYMYQDCPAACNVCHRQVWQEVSKTCPSVRQAKRTPSLARGGLNRLFDHVLQHNQTSLDDKLVNANRLNVTVHAYSRPDADHLHIDQPSVVQDKLLQPWLVVVDDFMAPDECRTLRDIATKGLGYGDSTYTLQSPPAQVVSEDLRGPTRTMESTPPLPPAQWSILSRLTDRVVQLMGLETGNAAQYASFWQISKYEAGQYHKVHHDYVPDHWLPQHAGARLVTVQVYLNDSPEAPTKFTNLHQTVTPHTGRAILFPNVLDSSLEAADARLRHQELPPPEGHVKWTATLWLHLYNYQQAQEKGCVLTV